MTAPRVMGGEYRESPSADGVRRADPSHARREVGRPACRTTAPRRQADELMQEVEGWIEAEMRRLDPEAYAPAAAVAGESR